ncbi:MAG TPA: carbamoyl-phosphate synthase large subunit [Nitrospiria bacterium]|nr:carbamoyl-phosphate synthase large subunit [Nitrospiria bacterium]
MPKRTDIRKILLIGSGPIVIGQACEFDYSGTQACKALKEEGYQVVLVNSNPATIMTDPEFADRTYVEPIIPEVLEAVIAKERPDALLPTMGGQTALNAAIGLADLGVLDRLGVKLIGANADAIRKAEDREAFKWAMQRIGLEVPESGQVSSLEDAERVVERTGFPAIIRPSFTLGGTGGSVAYNRQEFAALVEEGLAASPTHQVLVEQSVLGWKEFELEVMRDLKDNVVVICSIENLDPMGIHTGDSITVAPAQTLTDREYQRMRDAAIAVIREIGVETGGSNIQFAVHPGTGRMVVIEMNPRVSRSSALASKATGYPIAKIAAKLAVGYTLDEIPNDITKAAPASFEPTIDYVVVKIPRFAFEKFPQAEPTLTTQMKSVGEVMAIGRTFKESFQKAIRSLEIDRHGLDPLWRRKLPRGQEGTTDIDRLKGKLQTPGPDRLWAIADALRLGMSIEEIVALTAIDAWFVDQMAELIEFEALLQAKGMELLSPAEEARQLFRTAKAMGFSDRRLADLAGTTELVVRRARDASQLAPVYKRVDTCGAEFEAITPYLYSTWEQECESRPVGRRKMIVLGSGPNRIGQGIEFDYCCVHASLALKECGYESIMVNCNPETVSTDYDTSDRLYFEPLTEEDVLQIIKTERPEGVVVQFGGQTPLKLALPLEREGVKIFGTSPDAIDRAEDRERFNDLIRRLNLRQPDSGTARSTKEALEIARRLGFPVMVRPSYVLGGRAMEIVFDEPGLNTYMLQAVKVSPQHPVLIDKYLSDAIEVDVDAVSDGRDLFVAGVMEHIEEAGVHSGDSACVLPPHSLSKGLVALIKEQTRLIAAELQVVGLMNLQFAVRHGELYVLEVNPRASRTVPFVSKTIGRPLAKIAMKAILGMTLREQGVLEERPLHYTAVKEAVFPFRRFHGVDTILGPEMKSTGEVMGIDRQVGLAFAKAQAGAGGQLPMKGRIFISVRDADKPSLPPLASALTGMGFELCATQGTAGVLRDAGIPVATVNKVQEGRPHVVDHLKNREIVMIINTVGDKQSQLDSYSIRRTALEENIAYYTTMAGARAVVAAIAALREHGLSIAALQDYHHK